MDIMREITSLWQTDELRRHKPTPVDGEKCSLAVVYSLRSASAYDMCSLFLVYSLRSASVGQRQGAQRGNETFARHVLEGALREAE